MTKATQGSTRPAPSVGNVLDFKYWLNDSRAFYRANRMGVGRFIPLSDLQFQLRRLSRDGIVSDSDCQELIQQLTEEGLL